MADKLKYRVIRRHDGDRMYEEGEIREGTKAELGHLVPNALQPIEEGAKSEAAPMNKMEKSPASNKRTEAVDYQSMTVPQLKDMAEKRSVDLGDATKKADIIAALELSDEDTSR